MIQEFVEAWDSRKDYLKEWFRSTIQGDLSYEVILKALIEKVINPFERGGDWDAKQIHVIDDGDYNGCQLFVVPRHAHDLGPFDYFITYQYYGSCSVCDALEGIRGYRNLNETPDEEQVKGYMTLALQLLQHCRDIFEVKNSTE